MKRYPWTSQKTIDDHLQQACEEAKDPTNIKRIDCIEEFFEEMRNRKTPWYQSLWWSMEHWLHDTSWAVYRWFKPCHDPVRKAIPRAWSDCTQLILDVNFAIIKEFVEEEMDNVVWDDEARPILVEAGQWLRDSYEYITRGRAVLEDSYHAALKSKDDLPLAERKKMTYAEKYSEANKIEQEIEDRDEQVLVGMAKHRKWMWT